MGLTDGAIRHVIRSGTLFWIAVVCASMGWAADGPDPGSSAEMDGATSNKIWEVTLSALPSDERLDKIQWDRNVWPVSLASDGKQTQAAACLKGRYAKEDWVLVWKDQGVAKGTAAGTPFEICVYPLQEYETPFPLLAVGPRGEKQSQRFLLQFVQAQVFMEGYNLKHVAYSSIIVSAGFTFHRFKETARADLTMGALTLKASGSFELVPPWLDVAGNVFFTAIPLFSNAAESVRFLGANARAGVVMPWPPKPWRLSLLVGAYYGRMFVTDNRFGYADVIYPQIYPVLRRVTASGLALLLYFKYVPLSAGLSFSMEERELAAGGGVTLTLPDGRGLTLMLDLADMRFNISDIHSLSSMTLGLSAGVNL